MEFENDQDAQLGNVLSLEIERPTGFTFAPVVRYPKAEQTKNYELVMVDYDKMRMNKEDWLIWNVDDLTGEVIKTGYNVNPDDVKGKGVKEAFDTIDRILWIEYYR